MCGWGGGGGGGLCEHVCVEGRDKMNIVIIIPVPVNALGASHINVCDSVYFTAHFHKQCISSLQTMLVVLVHY